MSIGGVRMEGETLEEAVNRADHFMYQAKIQKNMVVTEERKLQDPEKRRRKSPKILKIQKSPDHDRG
ncbi:MAG: hypothetical protein ACLR6B_15260 [Blautia sp.]